MATMDVDTVSAAVAASKTKYPQADPADTQDPEKDDDALTPSKPLDANRYATKKTIAQGMLDIALLTANASQLKYILQVGPRHEFYSLMLGLISTSMILQVLNGILMIVLSASYNINKSHHHLGATIINDIVLSVIVLITAVNVVIGVFDMRTPDEMPGHLTTEATLHALAFHDLQTS